MRSQRLAAAQNVAEQLFEVENAIDVALLRAAKLTAAISAARIDANLSAVFGQDALDRSSAALGSIVTARRQMVETHHSLSDLKDEIGLRAVAIGGGMLKPPAAEVQHPALKSVA